LKLKNRIATIGFSLLIITSLSVITSVSHAVVINVYWSSGHTATFGDSIIKEEDSNTQYFNNGEIFPAWQRGGKTISDVSVNRTTNNDSSSGLNEYSVSFKEDYGNPVWFKYLTSDYTPVSHDQINIVETLIDHRDNGVKYTLGINGNFVHSEHYISSVLVDGVEATSNLGQVPVPPSILFLVTGMMGLVLKRN